MRMMRKVQKHFKRLIAFVLVVCSSIGTIAFASEGETIVTEEGIIIDVVSDEKYDDWDLQWEYQANFYDLLVNIKKDQQSISYEYDENYNRIQKTYDNKEIVEFSYDEEGNLIQEQRDGNVIQFIYSFNEATATDKVVGFVYNDVEYTYKYSDYVITEILCENESVAKYIYDGKINVDVQQMIDGEWVSNDSEDFVGNINKIRYKGYYYDDETGWYYDGRYLDPKYNRFIDGMNQREAANMISKYGVEFQAEILLASNFFGLDMSKEDEVNSLARSDNFGSIETVARVLYAESSIYTSDQLCVTWVVYNRSVAQGKSPLVIVTSGAFSGYQSENYYNPDKTKATWTSAVTEATYICTGRTPTSKPSGFTTQKHFRSISNFQQYLTGNSNTLYYKGERICDVYVVGRGLMTNYSVLKYGLSDMKGKYNIFFKFYGE